MQSRPSRFLIRAVEEPNRNLPARRQDDQPIELEFEVVDGPGVEDSSEARGPRNAAGQSGSSGDLPGPDMIAEAIRIQRRSTLFRWLRHTVIITSLLLILIHERVAWAKSGLVLYSILAALSLIGRFKLISLNNRMLRGLSGMAQGPGRTGRL